MTDHPGAKLKLAVNNLMGEIIDMGKLLTSDEVVLKQFRAQVLRRGNDLVRDMNETLSENRVRYTIDKEELKMRNEQ